MNLSSLQYIDINNAITTVVSVSSYPAYSTLLRDSACCRKARHVVVESTGRQRNQFADNSPEGSPLPLIEAWPIFPNSLLSTEIAVNLPDLQKTSLSENTRPDTVENPGKELDFPMDTSLHYRLQEPLPSYLGGLMYRAGSHAIVILDDEATLNHTDTRLIHELHVALNTDRYRGRPPGEVLIPHFLDSNNTPGGSLKGYRRGTVMIELYRLANLCHRLNVIGKADMVLCDSSGIAVDSLRSSVPVAFICGPPPGFEAMQDCVDRFLQHHDRRQLLNEQQMVLDDMLMQTCSRYHVMSNQHTLHSLIRSRLTTLGTHDTHKALASPAKNAIAVEQSSSGQEAQGYEELILRTQQTLCSRANKAVRLKSGLESSRRKFQKFKESPTRFMEDSQSVILRSLVSGRGGHR